MKHTILYDDNHEIVKQNVIGDYSSEDARNSEAIYLKALKDKPYKQLVVNLSKAGKMESREARKIQNECLMRAGFTDVAFVGASSATRMIAKVMMKLSSETIPTEFFKTEDEAVDWLIKRRGKNE